MTKLPSYLKGLVESRARSAGDVERLEQLRAVIDEQLADARKRRDAADVLIRDFSPQLDPTTIEPVNAHKGRYGKHGSLKKTIRAVLEEAGSESLPSPEIAFKVAERLGVKFDSMEQYREWSGNSVFRELKRLAKARELECIPGENRGCVTRWRLKPAGADGASGGKVEGLEGLRALAAAS
jgi:hypothetical protein